MAINQLTVLATCCGLLFASSALYAQTQSSERVLQLPTDITKPRRQIEDDTDQTSRSKEEQAEAIGTGRDAKEDTTRRAFQVKYGMRLEWTASDNLSRTAPGTERDGQLYEIGPYITASMATATSWTNIFVGATLEQGLTFDFNKLDGDSSGTGFRVSAEGDISLTGNNLLRIKPQIFFLKASEFSLDDDNLGLSTGDGRYSLLGLTPYSKGKLGSSMEYLLQWKLRHVSPTGDQADSLSNRIGTEIGSRGFSDWGFGWAGRVDAGRTDFEDDRSFDSLYSELTLEYLINPRFRVGLGVSYADIEGVADSDGNESGVGPVATWEWRPAKSALFSGRYARAYYGDSTTISFKRNSGRWAAGVSYSKGVEDNNTAGALFFQPRDAFALGRATGWSDKVSQGLVDRSAVLGAATPLSFDSLNSPLVFNETVYLSAAYVTTRSTILGVIYGNEMTGAIVPVGTAAEQLRRFGATVDYSYKLTRRHEVSFSLGSRNSRPGSAGLISRFNVAGLGWQTRLSRRLLGTLNLRHVREASSAGGARITENALSAVLDYRF